MFYFHKMHFLSSDLLYQDKTKAQIFSILETKQFALVGSHAGKYVCISVFHPTFHNLDTGSHSLYLQHTDRRHTGTTGPQTVST